MTIRVPFGAVMVAIPVVLLIVDSTMVTPLGLATVTQRVRDPSVLKSKLPPGGTGIVPLPLMTYFQ